MTKSTNRGLAALLALALVAVALPATPAAASHGLTKCNADTDYREKGYIATSHAGTNQGYRASQTLYLRLFNEQSFSQQVSPVDLQSWTNGQDAYVVDLPCKAGQSHDYCIERLDYEDAQDGGAFAFPLPVDPDNEDYRVAFYGPGPSYELIEDQDPDVDDSVEACQNNAPDGATYAVVYLASGSVSGIHLFDEQVWGPYAEHFDFNLEGDLAN